MDIVEPLINNDAFKSLKVPTPKRAALKNISNTLLTPSPLHETLPIKQKKITSVINPSSKVDKLIEFYENLIEQEKNENSENSIVQTPISNSPEIIFSPYITPPRRTRPNVVHKILIIGNAKCGKTSIIRRFVNNSFSGEYTTTIGADFVRKDFQLNEDKCVRLQLWDIAGQDRFISLTRAYFR